MKNELRKSEHRKPSELEAALAALRRHLEPVEDEIVSELQLSSLPMLFLVGCARSGTTLIYQYLSYSGLFCYPTNFISRFFYAPVLGAKIQQMLFDFDFRGEIFSDQRADERFNSRLGKTCGPLAPHEFWYFWRRFYQFGDNQQELTSTPDEQTMVRELRGFQSVFDKPLVMKAMNLNWNIDRLAESYDRAYFLFVRRDASKNANSLLNARREFFGDENHWYSFKPPGYENVLNLTPQQQTQWQVEQTNFAVSSGLANISDERKFDIELETFVDNPQQIIESICDRWNCEQPDLTTLPNGFSGQR